METVEKKVNDLSTAELEELLKEKRDEERKEKEAKKKEYEQTRESVIDELGSFAENLHGMLSDLKYSAMLQLTDFRAKMLEYGDLRNGEKNKGNFQIENETYRIQFSSHVNKMFDERAELAEKKLKAFLEGFVKKRDKNIYRIIQALLEKNEKTGDYDIGLINRLYKMEDQFDDKDWIEAIALFKESYSPKGTKQYVRFSKKNESGGWDALVLDFANVRPLPAKDKEAE